MLTYDHKQLPALFSIVLLLTGALAAKAQPVSGQQLIVVEKMRFDAMILRDTAKLSRFLAEDLAYIHSNGVVDNKTSLLKSIASGSIVYLLIIPEKPTATIEGNIGWVYGKANIRFKVADIDVVIDQYISYIDFFRLKQNQWQLVACQNARVNKDNPYFIKPPPQIKETIQPDIY